MTQVALKSVNKSFGKTHVIRDVDLEIEKGEFVVFVGPSGCGKSTLLRLIAGLETLSTGEISIAGREVMDLPPSKRGIAMVFQSYALYPHMTVFNNMAFSLDIQKFSKAEITERVQAAAKILQMEHLLDRRPAALSGGQRQRVAIGRAIVRDPEVFLFDEPLSNLDAALRHDTRVEIAKLHRQLGATTIYVTHDQVEAMTLADKIVVLKDGEVMQVGAPMDLFNMPANEFVAGFLGSPSINFFDGDLTDVAADGTTGSFSGEGLSLSGVRLVSKDKTKGATTRIGIRPQHLVLDPKGGLKGEVTLVERLGTETVVELISEKGTKFRFATPDNLELAVGDTAQFTADPKDGHLF
jgi:multiple sugar transport system ATP-binding protein